MASPRSEFAMVLLLDGTVLAAGGLSNFIGISESEIYNPQTGAWNGTGPLNVARSEHQMVALPDGTALVAGGIGSTGSPTLASAELYDPRAGTWALVGHMHTARTFFQMVLLPTGQVRGSQLDLDQTLDLLPSMKS
jgi:hypothetical protein